MFSPDVLDNGRFDRRPIYKNGTWYGRSSPNDPRFRLSRPFARGHFDRYGPSYYHRIVRFNRSNYWFWLADIISRSHHGTGPIAQTGAGIAAISF